MLTQPDFLEKKVVVVFSQNGEKVSFKNDNIVVTDNEGTVKMQFTCYRLFAVFIVGGFNLTSGIIERSKRFGFSIVLFTGGFKVYATINFALEGNTLLRKKQYTIPPELEVEIARNIIINKIENQRYMLKKLRNPALADGLANLDDIISKLWGIQKITNYEIMGLEGTASKIYFARFFEGFDWKGRQPRVKRDEINVLMDIGYTVLFNYVEAVLNIYGFDIYKGNLHREFYKRKSLVCDMVEPFRPIVDYKIRKAINLGQTKNYKFTKENEQMKLDWKDGNKFALLILEDIIKYRAEIYQYIQQYYRWFMKGKALCDFPRVRLDNDSD